MISFIPTTTGGWIELVALVVFGLLAAYGLFDKGRRDRTKEDNAEADTASKNLVDILKETVDQLKEKVDEQRTDIDTLIDQVKDLETKNKIFTDVFQGRDKETLEARAMLKNTYDLVKATNEQTSKFMQMMEGYMKAISSVPTPAPAQPQINITH